MINAYELIYLCTDNVVEDSFIGCSQDLLFSNLFVSNPLFYWPRRNSHFLQPSKVHRSFFFTLPGRNFFQQQGRHLLFCSCFVYDIENMLIFVATSGSTKSKLKITVASPIRMKVLRNPPASIMLREDRPFRARVHPGQNYLVYFWQQNLDETF